MNNATAVAETAAWPPPDFLRNAQMLRAQLEEAVRHEEDLSRRIAAIQDVSFKKALPVSVVAGSAEKFAELSNQHAAAATTANEKRNALREFLHSSRAGFFKLREERYMTLRPEIGRRFARAQAAATELRSALGDLLGAKEEAEAEGRLLREWNRTIRKLNRSIPAVNVNAIPSASGIEPGESIRSRIEGLFFEDPGIGELTRAFLAREAKERERIARQEELRLDQAEGRLNAILNETPF